MKGTYDYFRNNLLFSYFEPVLYYCGKEYWISYNNNAWYFIGRDGTNSQTFINSDDLLDNATIDGKLLSEIWDDVALIGGPMCSEIKIVLILGGVNLNFEEITEKMGILPTKTIKREGPENEWFAGEWLYVAFSEEDEALTVFEKTVKFANVMAGKEEAINMLKQKYKDNNMISVSLQIAGNPFINTTGFDLSPSFIAFAHKINTSISINSYWTHCDF